MSDLLLVGFVAVLALIAIITAARQYQRHQACEQLIGELTTAAAAFQRYVDEHPTAPAGADAGVVPAEMATYLTGIVWTAPTPVGGAYRWVNNSTNTTASAPSAGGLIAITAFPPGPPLTLSPADLLEIDRRIDDGNLATGNFRTGFNGWPVLSVRALP